MGIEFKAARLVDGLADDYECWYGEYPEALHQDKIVMYVRCHLWDGRNFLIPYPEGTKLKPLPPLGVVRQWY